MSVSPAAAALTFVALAVLIASVWAWLIAATRAALTWGWLPAPIAAQAQSLVERTGAPPRLPLVPWSARRPVPWAVVDLIVLTGIWLLASLAVSAALRQLGWIQGAVEVENLSLGQRKALILGNTVVSLSIAAIGLPLIALRTRATLTDFGWSSAHVLGDLRLGLIGFVMLAPPVYALQGVLVSFWKPSTHPLMEMFKGTPDSAFFVLLFVSAAVIAPLFEEVMFRVVIQGFLEKAFTFRGEAHELFFGRLHDGFIESEPELVQMADQQSDHSKELTDLNPYASPTTLPGFATRSEVAEASVELSGASTCLPIAISSAVFALLHYSHGPDWIPLLLLAAGMGYLYQRTHRLLPSLTVHALLNAFSMWGLWVQVQQKG